MYLGEEENGELPTGVEMLPLRVNLGSTDIQGTAEEIASEITLPESRIQSTPEIGSESNSGNVVTEWNIDEQDPLFAGLFCNSWEVDAENENKKVLKLGDKVKSYTFLKKYSQEPVAYQIYKKEFINQLGIDFSLDQFVKLTWNVMGSNNPLKEDVDPIADKTPVYKEAMNTKSFLTKTGSIKIGDSIESLVSIRQCPSMSVSINNNLEKTPALFEEESIENSLGYFVVDGSLEVYNVDAIGHQLYNDAVEGKDKVIQVSVERTVADVKTSYTLTMNVHLGTPTESKNGNKLQFAVPYKLNDLKNFMLEKTVETL